MLQVDAKHVSRHLNEAEKDEGRVSEAIEQVAMADTILLNKTDLVSQGGSGLGRAARHPLGRCLLQVCIIIVLCVLKQRVPPLGRAVGGGGGHE
mgnify:FL=1